MSGRTDATTGMGRTIDINGMKKEPDPHASNLSEPFKRFFYDGLDGGYPTRQPKYLFIINGIWRCAADCGPTFSGYWRQLFGYFLEEFEGLAVLTGEAADPNWG